MNWERYRKALFGSLDKARNIGFRKRDNHIVTYEQSKLGYQRITTKEVFTKMEFTQVVFKKKNKKNVFLKMEKIPGISARCVIRQNTVF